MKKLILDSLIVVVSTASIQGQTIKLDAKQKEATVHTKKTNNDLLSYLPFGDKTDFDNARKGFIATLDEGEIKDENGNVVYSMKQYDFIKGNAPATTNPSLWRQSELNSINGLFKVTDGVYQIRGFDLANMSLIEGNTGWIIVDPLLSPSTAKAGLDLANKHLGKRPVAAIIITHSHIDHFGGVRGIVDEADVKSGKVPIYVPEGFFEHSVAENVMGGNTMGRRASYMYGNLLAKDAKGTLGTGLGQTTSTGMAGILDGTHIINKKEESHTIDGIEVEFTYAPESEAPAEMMFYFPKYKAFCQAEDLNHTLHNLYTLRGAQVRNGKKWSQYIDHAIAKWGDNVTASFGSHHWPTWDNKNIRIYWESQRDLYRFIHDQTLRLANNGFTPREIAEMLKLPESLDKKFYNRGYYGSVSHDVRAQYQLYFGWFDGNPSNLNKLTPTDGGKKYVEFMGGANNLLAQAQKSYDKGEYRWVAEVVSHLVFAEPNNKNARYLLADAYEQLGYIAESGPWRNFYISGALELRNGVRELPTPNTAGPDMIKGMTTELFFNFLAMKFIGTDAEASKMKYNFNITMPDVNEKLALIVGNGTVTPRIGSHVKNDITADITLNRSDLDRINLGETSFNDLLKSKKIKIKGDEAAFAKFLSKIDNFKFWFNIVEP
ncbi:alkyl/aryl-sulfatase [Chryseobacterium turcicum]|uniref:Linear primary-alkylsulfatase n=1 Tax=Chryseobacterium turcicum TaxID=2898076 RepID=A0A9Q3V4N2_9FLAO|nr:alkyl sulfatase dimerization domain-containing protein [Chryseobacterium turcicum]MCD1117215.1 MBL fold metallo-hydrolase [Chryseobacterium turcicum]